MHTSLRQSLWFDTLGEPISYRSALGADIYADVAIIGAGYSGLWSAYYLKQKAPQLKIVLLDAHCEGEGASGRNGGWLMGSFAGDCAYLASLSGDKFQQGKHLIQSPVTEVARVLTAHGVDCDYVHSGNWRVAARYPEQFTRLKQELKILYARGYGEQDFQLFEAEALTNAVRMRDARAAIYTPHCATIHPLKLVRGLARIIESMGVTLYDKTRVLSFAEGRVRCETGSVRADIIIPALEGYQGQISSLGQYTLPVQSLLIATEPLSEDLWQQIGLADRATFSDAARLVTYGQRTADNRLVFGARGGYRFGGQIETEFEPGSEAFAWRARLMTDLFPVLKEVAISHSWGGTLAISRRFAPHAIFDKRAGIGLIGGYGGEGVGAANLFARTLSDLILGRESELTQMPWAHLSDVKSVLKPWESEPLRWLTYHLTNRVFNWEEQLCLQKPGFSLQKRLAIGLAKSLETLMH